MNNNAESVIERTEEILNDTRERVKNRADQLQAELSPSALLEQVIPEGQSASETIRQIGDAARSNPIASAMIAGGAMLLAREILGRRELNPAQAKPSAEKIAEQVGERVDELRGGVAATVNDLNRMAKSAGERVEDNIADARTKVGAAASAGEDIAEQAYTATRDQIVRGSRKATRIAQKGRRWVAQNPVAVGLGCAAAGALVASFFTARPLEEEQTERTSNQKQAGNTSQAANRSKPKSRRARKSSTTKKTSAKSKAPKAKATRRKPSATRGTVKNTTARGKTPGTTAKVADTTNKTASGE